MSDRTVSTNNTNIRWRTIPGTTSTADRVNVTRLHWRFGDVWCEEIAWEGTDHV